MKKKDLKKLLHSLTLEEKVGQLVQLSGDFFSDEEAILVGPSEKIGLDTNIINKVGSVLNVISPEKIKKIQESYLNNSRHRIPLLFMGDIIYGYKTVFPIPLGLGATWNPVLIEDAYKVLSEEAFNAGAHVTFAPMVDLVRDPRWGRSLESTGEDKFLNGQFAHAMVRGIQGELDENHGVAACVKHFAAYGASEGGRDYNTVDMSERELREHYLPAYKSALDAGSEMVMTSFNTVMGVPSTGNKWLMNDILREEWGFDGPVIADYAAIKELIDHGVAVDEKEAARLAINATVDIDMKTNCYAGNLSDLVSEKSISIEQIDQAVWRVLQLKNKIGLFENPYRGIDTNKLNTAIELDRPVAKKVVEESIVLLQNNNDILPLNRNKKIALIGPYADSKSIMGLWAVYGEQKDCCTIKEAFDQDSNIDFEYAKGIEIIYGSDTLGEFGISLGESKEDNTNQEELMNDAIEVANGSDVIVLALGEHSLQSGEAGSRTEIRLPSNQMKLLDVLSETKKPIILVLFNGRPLVLTDVVDKVDGIIEAWFPGTEGGTAIREIITGNTNPSGKLSMSFPYNEGQIPVYYNHYSTGRPEDTSTHSSRFVSKYLDAPNKPLFPFGYGLSYSSFKYSDLILSKNTLTKDNNILVSVTVTNESDFDGKETVQLYIHDLVGTVVRPVKELKDFKKILVKANEKVDITFEIDEDMLKFYNCENIFESEEGEFEIMVGGSSEEFLLEKFVYKK